MLNHAKTLKGYKLHSLDGEIGNAREFYFDDVNGGAKVSHLAGGVKMYPCN